MNTLTSSGDQALHDIAERHGFSTDAARSMLDALIAGRGSMAQFAHAEFGGSGQWMRGGMTMVSNLFDDTLRGRVDALCRDLAGLAESQADHTGTVSAQSQSQSFGNGSPPRGPFTSSSSDHWWPAGLGSPDSTGTQDGARYAWFAQAARLAVEVDGRVTVYDTQDHRIGGFSQAQSQGSTMRFHSQHGEVDVEKLPVVSSADSGPVDKHRRHGEDPIATRVVPGEGDAPHDQGSVARAVKRPASTAEAVTRGADPTTPTPGFVARPSLTTDASASAIAPTIPRGPSTAAARSPVPSASRAANADAPAESDVFALIEKLAALHAKGALTDDEFKDKKADLLGRI